MTQLISSCHDWATTIQSRGQVDVVFLDISKAFDKVLHRRLSVKLSYYGINGSTLTWINDFLRNRVQAVSVNGSHSTWGNAASGVPQGSVLGPALFLLYICDIKGKIQSNMRLYADDTIVYREINSINDHNILQEDLDTLSEWTTTWLMDISICKCATLPITKKRSTSFFNYTIFGNTLERVDDHEYLGISISNDLCWDRHCNEITKKASKTLGLLRRTISPCSKEVKTRAHQALVRPQFEYAAEAWNPYNITTADRLERIQRAAASFVHHDYLNKGNISVLALLDFSSAFDTIDHPILVHRLHTDFGFTDTVLQWFSSYLTDRTHYVSLSNHCSAFTHVHSGVPQGSVLGPILFTMYIKPLSAIIDSHSIIHHSFADDLQLQMSAPPDRISELLHSMQSCISDVKAWATANMLKLNDNLTELMLITSKRTKHLHSLPTSITIGNAQIPFKKSVKNLGFTLDCHLTMNAHVSNIARTCYFELRRLAYIRRFLTSTATATHVSAFVLSRIDYCNSLLFGS